MAFLPALFEVALDGFGAKREGPLFLPKLPLVPEVIEEAIEGELYRVRVGSPDTSTGNATLEVLCASPAPCPGDTNADGVVDVTDLVNVVLQWGSADPGSDLNDDGVVDVKDLLEVILAWGPCI